MDSQIDGRVDVWTDGLVGVRLNRLLIARINEWIDG